MAGLTQAMCTSFKTELLTGTHDFTNGTGNTFKIALFRATASIVGTYGAATTNYSDVTGNSDEATGTGYTAGGQLLDNVTISVDGTTAIVDIDDEVFTSSTISADGCIIYNASASNAAIAVIDFGGTQTSTNGDYTIQFPTADASNAIIRIA